MSTFMSGLRGKLLGVSGGLLLLMVAGVSRANSVTYVYTDPQGTPLAEADVNGNITATFDYAPYGSIALGTAPNGPGYTGHVNDPDTQLVYMQARYYDPAVGRFLSLDPVGPAAGNPYNFNRFAYANNNPIVNTDPSGKVTGSLINPDGGGVAGPGYTMFVNPSSSEGGGGKSAAPSKSTGSIAGGALGFIASLPVDLVEDGSTGGLGALANPATTVGMTAGGAAVGNAAQNGLINLVQMASKAFSSGGDGGGDKPSESKEADHVTPSQDASRFRRGPGNTRIDNKNGSVWEKDRGGQNAHGGEQWKRWPNQKDWENGQNRQSVWPNGVIRGG